MRYLLFALACGCTVADLDAAGGELDESEISSQLEIPACPTAAGQWCVQTAPVTGTLLHAVFAVNPNDVFAVGDHGTILRQVDNNAWTAMTSGTIQNLRSVWGWSSSDVWAGGSSGTLLHFNGTAWSTVSVPTSNVDAIWGSSATDVWFAGSGTVLHWNGTAFSSFGFGGTLLSISGTGPNDVWVSGESATLRHFTGASWVNLTVASFGSTIFAVLARATNDVWVGGSIPNKEAARWNGSKFSIMKTGVVFSSLSAVTSNDIWGVGVGGTSVGHWNGTTWTSLSLGSDAELWSVTTTARNAWIVGDNSLIAHREF